MFIFKKMSTKCSSLNSHNSGSFFPSSKNGIPLKKKRLVQLIKIIFLGTQYFGMLQKCLYISCVCVYIYIYISMSLCKIFLKSGLWIII